MIVFFYGKNGWIGSWFVSWDIQIIFFVFGMAIVIIFVILFFVVREVIFVLEELGLEQEEVVCILGVKDW